jgi:hypothetical protein
MKILRISCIILFSILFCYCSKINTTKNELGKGLKFYLLKDSSITAHQVDSTNINNLILADKPFLTYEEISYYIWAEHTFVIDSEKAGIIQNLCKNNTKYSGSEGIPFVVTVDNERIYLGAFWYGFSSLAPIFPYIDALFMNGRPTILTIRKAWIVKQPDVRNDPRIYRTLTLHGLIK